MALVEVPAADAAALAARLWRAFAHSGSWGWIWENLRVPSTSARLADRSATPDLAEIVPDAQDLLLFDVDAERPAARRGSRAEIIAHVADSYGSEWLIAPADLTWFLCENHHTVLVAAGEPIESRLRAAVSDAHTSPPSAPAAWVAVRDRLRAGEVHFEPWPQHYPYIIQVLSTGDVSDRENAAHALEVRGHVVERLERGYRLVDPATGRAMTVAIV